MTLFYKISGDRIGPWLSFSSELSDLDFRSTSEAGSPEGDDFFESAPKDLSRQQVWAELSKTLEVLRTEGSDNVGREKETTRLRFFSLLYHSMKNLDVVEVRFFQPERS